MASAASGVQSAASGPAEPGRPAAPRGLIGVFKSAAVGWFRHGAMELAAAIAYFAMFSLAPLLVIAVAVAGMVFDPGQARQEVVGQFGSMVGREGGELIGTVMENASKPREGMLSTILSVGMLVVGASGAFGQLKESLDRVWEVKHRPSGGVWGFLRGRFLSFGMVMVLAFLLLVSLAVSALLAGIGGWAGESLPGWAVLLRAANFVLSLLVTTALFGMILRFLPAVHIAWREVWLGAAATALLFALGKFLIGQYLGRAAPGSVYGAAGSMAVVLIWVYYSALIFLFGAELTRAHSAACGTAVRPKAGAELCRPGERGKG